MGDVWRAVHVLQQVPIAVKVMRNEPITSRARQAFVNEVTQIAKLDHQGIVRVFDFGDVTAMDADASEGIIRAGHPYIVMEVAKRGSLDHLDEILTWRDLLGIIRSLLSALGHAHARGVLHRDIKPGNILLGSDADLRPSIKLTDFGLARTHIGDDGPGTGMRIVGTPNYMAPEQIEGLWRDQGPWTDLYALGCVAYELASGQPPFTGSTNRQVTAGHLSSPVPPLTALSPVPDGFEDWLQRMLAKDTHERFQCAADAAHALDQLADVDGLASVAQRKGARTASPTWTFLDLPPPVSSRAKPVAGTVFHPEDAPPIPSDWRELERRSEAAPLMGSSLSLFGLRTHRMVGRHTERDALWQRLQDVSTSGRPGAVLLKGPSGYGKQRLANWLMELAHEAGAASVMEAQHSEIPGPATGLPRMLAHEIQTIGLSATELIGRTEAVLRLHGVLDSFEWEHLGRMLLSASGAVSNQMHVPAGNTAERLALITRYIERKSIHRPIVLHIANAQWGFEALSLVQKLLQARADRLPLLVVISCDTEALEHRAAERRALETLEGLPDLDTVHVGAMPAEDQDALVRDLLRVETGLARSVTKRSSGSPLFAIQLVEDWVRRGVLQPGANGFSLSAGENTALPDSIHEVWQGRLQQALRDLDHASRDALTVAAALGHEVEEDDWASACTVLNIKRPTRLVSRLVSNGLAHLSSTGWSFTHTMLRESIERRSGDQWAAINRGCANMLAGRTPEPGMQERMGRHLVAAREYEDALAPLLAGAWEAIRMGDSFRAGDLLEIREQMMAAIQLPESDSRHGDGLHASCAVAANLGDSQKGRVLASQFADSARRYNWQALLSPAFRMRGFIAYITGDHSQADAMYARAASFVVEGDHHERANVLRHWARALRTMGDAEAALNHLTRAAELFAQVGDELEVAHCDHDLAATIQSINQDDTRAEQHLNRALEIYGRLGSPAGVGDCWNGIAEIHRQRGNLAAAEDAYQTAFTHLSRSGSFRAIVPKLNRGLIRLQRDDFDKASEIFSDCLSTIGGGNDHGLEAYFRLGLLSCTAHAREWEQFDHHLGRAEDILSSSGMADRDLAWPAEEGGDRAVAEGERTRAERAWRLAQEQWRRIGATEQADRLAARLGATQG